MKHIAKQKIIYTILICMCSIFISTAQEMDLFEIQVDGLGCPFCAYGLEKKFKEFKGIKKVKIDIETGDFSFQYPTEKLSMAQVTLQVEKAGYTPISAKITRANGKIEVSDTTTQAIANTTTKEAQFFVAGNCGMCKARIENAIRSLPGIVNASWDADTKQCEVAFNEEAISLTEIQAKIAEVGHDNNHKKANDAVYETLPGCCKYERITNTKTQN